MALTGRKEPSFQHRNSYQEIAHAPAVRGGDQVFEPGRFDRRIAAACSAMPGARRWPTPPRPTHLDFCGLQGDVIELGQTSEPTVIDPEARRIPAHRPVADERDIERAAAALTASRRVAIVAGDGAAASQAGPEVLALAEALAAPVATSLGARGIIPTRHQLVGRRPRQLFGAARQPHRSQRRSGALCRLRYRRPGHLELDRTVARDPRSCRSMPTRSRSGAAIRTRSGSSVTPRRRWPASPRRSDVRRATAALPRRRRGSSPIGARRWRRSSPTTGRQSGSSGCARRSPRHCRRTASWWRIPVIPASGPGR